ncbi:Sperm-associated antigen 8 [Myotis brandtii]|uniref:Sperm-associated antigen 8 n=1 Tax=Myotis brandtii TaxID=109478 RepID=S7NM94_MYOBR|nr:Sperm-associated antigen 8 [Myotis brandtii]
MQDGSESFYFRHGHQGLLTLQLQSPMPLSTTQKDAYQTPRNRCQPIRGVEHEGMGQNESTSQRKKKKEFLGVSNIKTLDTPFRKNCSFSTPVPLSLEQPFPDGPENYSHQLGQISSLGCQGRGQGGEGGRTV